jgi:hypothetical protein
MRAGAIAYDGIVADELREIERRRSQRVWPERDLSLGEVLGEEERKLRQRHRAVGCVAELWNELTPAGLVEKTELVGLTQGVLRVRVSDSSARFALDRWLRTGGEAELVRRAPVGVRKIKLVS